MPARPMLGFAALNPTYATTQLTHPRIRPLNSVELYQVYLPHRCRLACRMECRYYPLRSQRDSKRQQSAVLHSPALIRSDITLQANRGAAGLV
jgi:hypothetical protein